MAVQAVARIDSGELARAGLEEQGAVLRAQLLDTHRELVMAKFVSPRSKTVTWRIEATAFGDLLWQAEVLWSPPFVQDKPVLGRMVLSAKPQRQQLGFQMMAGTAISGRVYVNNHFALTVKHTFSKKAPTHMWDLASFVDTDEPLMIQVDFDVISGPSGALVAELISE
jgi:hypothetical protein